MVRSVNRGNLYVCITDAQEAEPSSNLYRRLDDVTPTSYIAKGRMAWGSRYCCVSLTKSAQSTDQLSLEAFKTIRTP